MNALSLFTMLDTRQAEFNDDSQIYLILNAAFIKSQNDFGFTI